MTTDDVVEYSTPASTSSNREFEPTVPTDDSGVESTSSSNREFEVPSKVKTLLKLAMERIQAQESELQSLRDRIQDTKKPPNHTLPEYNESLQSHTYDVPIKALEEDGPLVTRVCQSLVVDTETLDTPHCGELEEPHTLPTGINDTWALIEYESSTDTDTDLSSPRVRFRRWRRFPSTAALETHIQRSGEPILLPTNSLSVDQSLTLQRRAEEMVSCITEEFRRFRVRAEQRETLMESNRDALQRCDTTWIEEDSLVERIETRKRDCELLLAENDSLRSARGETLLASQWRKRYEKCVEETHALKVKVTLERDKVENAMDRQCHDDEMYEAKYIDLTESFRMYRNKAMEIFEQQGDGGDTAKLAYLKNLLVHYFSSTLEVRGHIEGAIGTVLGFSAGDKDRIERKKEKLESWFG